MVFSGAGALPAAHRPRTVASKLALSGLLTGAAERAESGCGAPGGLGMLHVHHIAPTPPHETPTSVVGGRGAPRADRTAPQSFQPEDG